MHHALTATRLLAGSSRRQAAPVCAMQCLCCHAQQAVVPSPKHTLARVERRARAAAQCGAHRLQQAIPSALQLQPHHCSSSCVAQLVALAAAPACLRLLLLRAVGHRGLRCCRRRRRHVFVRAFSVRLFCRHAGVAAAVAAPAAEQGPRCQQGRQAATPGCKRPHSRTCAAACTSQRAATHAHSHPAARNRRVLVAFAHAPAPAPARQGCITAITRSTRNSAHRLAHFQAVPALPAPHRSCCRSAPCLQT